MVLRARRPRLLDASSHVQGVRVTGLTLRVIERDGDPWFVAKDVCAALGMDDVSTAVYSLDGDERITVRIPEGKRGNPNKTLVSEPGLYSLVLRYRHLQGPRISGSVRCGLRCRPGRQRILSLQARQWPWCSGADRD